MKTDKPLGAPVENRKARESASGMRMTRIKIDRGSWIAGFRDGEKNVRARSKVSDGFSYESGWIEGAAKRQGCSYSLGTLKPEDVWPDELPVQFREVRKEDAEEPTGLPENQKGVHAED